MRQSMDRAWNEWIGHPIATDVPIPLPSVAVAAKLVVDEGLLWAMSKLTPQSDSREDLISADRELNSALEYYDHMGWIDDPQSFHATPPVLEKPEMLSAWAGTMRYEEMRFASEYSPPDHDPARDAWMSQTENTIAHARVMRHRGAQRPWIICLHGFGMGTTWTDFGAFRSDYMHRVLGMNVINYVAPLHGPRARKGSHGRDYFDNSPTSPIHGGAQAVWDLRRIIGWIRSQGDARIGVHGMSLGGSFASLLATLEPDLDCVVAGIPATSFSELFRMHTEEVKRPGDDFWHRLSRLHRVISPIAQPVQVPQDRLFIYAGLVDRLVPPELPRALWSHWGEPRILWYHGSHVTSVIEPSVRNFLDDAFVQTGLATKYD